MMAFYYMTRAGISRPWEQRHRVRLYVSGDDVLVAAEPDLAEAISASVRRLTSDRKDG
jgi:hypothetical protein